jgi:hypothetical protein
MLPHFTESKPLDINERLGLSRTTDKDVWQVEFETNPATSPVELKHLDRVTPTNPEELQVPPSMRSNDFSDPKSNMFMTQAVKSAWRNNKNRNYRKYQNRMK